MKENEWLGARNRYLESNSPSFFDHSRNCVTIPCARHHNRETGTDGTEDTLYHRTIVHHSRSLPSLPFTKANQVVSPVKRIITASIRSPCRPVELEDAATAPTKRAITLRLVSVVLWRDPFRALWQLHAFCLHVGRTGCSCHHSVCGNHSWKEHTAYWMKYILWMCFSDPETRSLGNATRSSFLNDVFSPQEYHSSPPPMALSFLVPIQGQHRHW